MLKTIGIIGAMPSELADIRNGLPDSEIQKKAGFDYYINQVGDTRIVHVCSGIAKVNAAVCTQALIDNFAPDAVINAGIAGGMNNDIHVCDVVVSSEVLPHDLDLHFLKDYPPYCGIYTADQALIGSQDLRFFRSEILCGTHRLRRGVRHRQRRQGGDPAAAHALCHRHGKRRCGTVRLPEQRSLCQRPLHLRQCG